MATHGPDSRFLFLAGYDLGADGMLSELGPVGMEATIQETTGPMATRPTHKPTGHVGNDDLTASLWVADGADGDVDTQSIIDAALALPTTSRVVSYGYAGDVVGQPYTAFLMFDASVKPVAPGTELTKVELTMRPTGGIEHGEIVVPLAQISGDGNTESASCDSGTFAAAVNITSSSVANPSVITTDAAHGLTTGDTVLIAGHTSVTPDINGAHTVTVTGATTFTIAVNVTDGGTGGTATLISTRNGGRAHLQVTQFAGFTDVTVTVRDSMDDSTYADLVAFTATTAAPTAQRVTVSGVVNRYLATAHVKTGSGTCTRWVGFSRA